MSIYCYCYDCDEVSTKEDFSAENRKIHNFEFCPLCDSSDIEWDYI